MNGLDFFEQKIKALIEMSAAFFPSMDKSAELMAKLCEVIRDTICTDDQPSQDPPRKFVIKMNPEDLAGWKKTGHWEDDLLKAYLSIMNEYGIKVDRLPSFLLVEEYAFNKGVFTFEVVAKDGGLETVNILQPDSLSNEILKPPGAIQPVLIFSDQREIKLSLPVTTIGRRNTNDIVIDDIRISRTHAQIRRTQKGWFVFDAGSTGGTFVNNERITRQLLNPGDVISLSGYQFIFSNDSSPLDSDDQRLNLKGKDPVW